MPLVSFPPDRGGSGGGGAWALIQFLRQHPLSTGAPVRRHGPFSSAFSPAFLRNDP
jgi:hypothetical protein